MCVYIIMILFIPFELIGTWDGKISEICDLREKVQITC